VGARAEFGELKSWQPSPAEDHLDHLRGSELCHRNWFATRGGLPADFDIKSGKRFGMRLINAFATQLKATLHVPRRSPGTEFILSVPAAASSRDIR
jgi:two-component sensor histidine kinase